MNHYLTLLLFCYVSYCFGAPLQNYLGKHEICIENKGYEVNYNVTANGNDFIVLDEVDGLTSLTCNIDDSKILLTFESASKSNAFAAKLKPAVTYLTAGKKFHCDKRPIMRLVFKWTPYNKALKGIVIECQAGKYSDVIKDADISFGPSASSIICNQKNNYGARDMAAESSNEATLTAPGASADICLPINANKACTAAAGPIQIYANEYLTITCTNCFLALNADIFMDIHMTLWEMTSFAGGFKNIEVLGAMVVEFFAHYQWSAGIDNQQPIVKPTTVIDIWLGPIPIRVWFEIPLTREINADFDATATATIGATVKWNIGDAYVTWDWESGWKHVSPHPVLTWDPVVVAPKAEFTATALFAMVPSFSIHVDGFYDISYILNPALHMKANGTTVSKELCGDMYYHIDITVESQLSITIPWFAIHWQDTYSRQVYDSGDVQLAQKCIKF